MEVPCYELENAQELARHLPDYVFDDKRSGGVQVWLNHKSGDGRGLYVHTQDKKWRVSLQWPRCHLSNRPYEPDGDYSIGVNPARGMEAVAKDITRRLLGDYDTLYAEQLKKQQDAKAYYDSRTELRNQLVAALEHEIPKNDSSEVTLYRYGVDSLRVCSDTIELHIDLPHKLTFELIEWLKERMPERKFSH